MLLAMICLALFILIELVLNFKKHLTYSFMLYFIGIAMFFFGCVLYITKFTYLYIYNDIDRIIYEFIIKFHFGISDISRIINLGISLFMFGSIYLYNIIGKKARPITNICLILLILLMLFLYDPWTTYKIFLYINTVQSISPDSFTKFFNCIILSVFIANMIIPFVKLIRQHRKTRIYAILANAVFLGICLLMIYAYVIWCFVLDFLSPLMPWSVDLNKFSMQTFSNGHSLIILPLTLLFIMVVLYITLWRKPLGSIKFLNTFTQRRNFKEINSNLKMVFHSNKNAFLTIERLSNELLEYIKTDPETAITIVEDIHQIGSNGVATLTDTLNTMSNIKTSSKETNLCQCITYAVNKVNIPEHIEIRINNKYESVIIEASPFHITECVINILHNSIEAINEANNKNGIISIDIIIEENYACVEITDNGCGIPKKDFKNIFSLLYSTKKTSTNWGVGLTYVQKVIAAYDGFIHAKSEIGNYTTFQLAFPLKNRRQKNAKNQNWSMR